MLVIATGQAATLSDVKTIKAIGLASLPLRADEVTQQGRLS
jgi:hypothetical protein